MLLLPFFILIFGFAYGDPSKLLVVSFDGFRHDYFNLNLTPNLSALRAKGVSTPYMKNIFPTQTFPNHFSIATGLYAEVHGVLCSGVYNSKTGQMIHYPNLWSYNKDVVPFWTLNERAGGDRHSGCMMWPGGEFKYGGTATTYTHPLNETEPWEQRVDKALSWMTHPSKPANVVFMYFEDPDALSHAFGPFSEQAKQQLKRVDKIAGYLLKQLEKKKLSVNLVFVSDHGLAGVYKKDIINAQSACPECKMVGTSPVRHVFPPKGTDVNSVYNKLKALAAKTGNFEVYLKKDIPERWHFKNCELIPPILLVSKVGYAFEDLYDGIKWYKDHYPGVGEDQPFGVHGYDPEEPSMHPFFIAHGPAFKPRTLSPPFDNIDLYPLFAHVSGLQLPALRPNGSFENIKHILDGQASLNSIAAVSGAVGTLLLLLAFLMVTIRPGKKFWRFFQEEKHKQIWLKEKMGPYCKVQSLSTESFDMEEGGLASTPEKI